MHPEIAGKLDALRAICAARQVKSLSLVGSAARDDFDPARSDVDVLAEFLPVPFGQALGRYMGLIEDLEALFGRHVDVVARAAVTNPFLVRSFARDEVPIYGAA
jgi:hypothetical protein